MNTIQIKDWYTNKNKLVYEQETIPHISNRMLLLLVFMLSLPMNRYATSGTAKNTVTSSMPNGEDTSRDQSLQPNSYRADR